MGQYVIHSLPVELEPYRHQLEATVQPFIKISATPGTTQLWQSKILGLPYLPKGTEYPKDAEGNPLLLLAQLNFANIPSLPDYPETGILQFFISATDQVFGMSFDGFESMQQQKNFCVRYFETTVQDETTLVTDFEFLRTPLADTELDLPAEQECQLTFEIQQEIVSLLDYRFDRWMGEHFLKQFGAREEELWEALWNCCSSQGHKIGGYAFFTQTDPRRYAPVKEDWRLLLQIDSDAEAGIMWGDVGVGSFFIQREHLLLRDFSRVLYSWDCG